MRGLWSVCDMKLLLERNLSNLVIPKSKAKAALPSYWNLVSSDDSVRDASAIGSIILSDR